MNIENRNGEKCVISDNNEVIGVIKQEDGGFYLDKKAGFNDEDVNEYISDLNKMTLHKNS